LDNGTHHAATQALIADIPTPAMPCWVPDGSAVAYLWDDGAGWEVWIAGAAGQGARQLTTGALLSAINWTGDGAEIVFARRVEDGSGIAAVNLVGEVRQITHGPRDRSPQVSPDGTTVAFLSGRAGAFDVWKVPLDGGAATQLTERTNPLDEPRWTPRWSPDGRWLAYVSSRSGERNNDDLWIVSADGRENRQLTTGLIVDTDPIWSPDGKRLAIVANSEVEHWYGDDLDLWLVDLDDVRPRRVTTGGGVTRKLDGGAVSWSPDGRFV
jgi:Tol biopolymer transport system component